MEPLNPILYVKSEKREPGPSPDLSSALCRIGHQVMITDISEIESVVTHYIPMLAIARLPGRQEADLRLCRLLLRTIYAPVIVISSLDDVNCRIASFDAGIQDFLVSPVSPLIVVARVRAILRRRAYKMEMKLL
jgi:DNA-binding response OmpR family regulator